MDDPCDDIVTYWAYIRWANLLMNGEIAHYSWFWIRGNGHG